MSCKPAITQSRHVNNLIRIPEPSIFAIRPRIPRILTHKRILPNPHFALPTIPPLILPPVIQIQDHCHHSTTRLRPHHRQLRRPIPRRILGLKRLRPYDITDTERSRHHSSCEGALRRAGYIRCRPSVENRQGSHDGVDEVDASEAAGAVGEREEAHEGAAEDGGQDADEDPEPTVGLLADAEADEEGEEDADGAGGCVY